MGVYRRQKYMLSGSSNIIGFQGMSPVFRDVVSTGVSKFT